MWNTSLVQIMLVIVIASILFSCGSENEIEKITWQPYDESSFIVKNETHQNPRMKYKLIQSKILDMNSIFSDIQNQLSGFSEADYLRLKPLIIEQDIDSIQFRIDSDEFSYKELVQWYLYRILKYESDSSTVLHTIISINPNAVAQAEECDRKHKESHHPIFGMPILLKDNINTEAMPTTGGAFVLKENNTPDAALVKKLKNNGAIILGKVNLSEWAYYFCDACPVGYSAIGGQTLNPYGRMQFETGGSSAGSGVAIAANYAVAAIGTETSGSILSPSSQNSVVGLKPTHGTIEGEGIIPISKNLDTAGPMSKSVKDNAILMSAISNTNESYLDIDELDFKLIRFAVFKSLYQSDSLYKKNVDLLVENGADTFLFNSPSFSYKGFITLLNQDMKRDLPAYMSRYVSDKTDLQSVDQIRQFNMKDSSLYMPYGQGRFDAISADSTTAEVFEEMKSKLFEAAHSFFDQISMGDKTVCILSINNYHAGQAALAKHPCLTVPMGYESNGEPKNLTFIGHPGTEKNLYEIAYTFEKFSKCRNLPQMYN